ncbi:MAG TPA: 3-hydroxyacyl-CoA dehydrogenase NAD-binding domain-containing protein [Gemmataceae bacterium]|nr:3-hydroxyacyl-CoA dehydrogenase NAD-binding domain-containing protein [Gemmataceae bacterium]
MQVFHSATIVVERDPDGALALILDVPGRSVNVFNRQVMADLDAALDAVAASKAALLVVRSGKKSGFVAGADLQEFLNIQDARSAEAISASGQKLFDKLAALPMPTIAAISGACLGGGLEFALACDYRLVFDKPSTQMGLPEVELGLLPGWGGTQRLPRIIGLERALRVILDRKRLNAAEAFRWGLADAIAATETELREQFGRLTGRAIGEGKRRLDRLPLRTWRQRILESNPLGRRALFQITERLVRRSVWDDMPAPFEALEAIRAGIRDGMTAGLAYERAAAGRLAVSSACRNLIGLFFQTQKSDKLPEELHAAKPVEVRRVGVVGAGTMGAGIAQLAAFKGCKVVVQEVSQAALDAGLERIKGLFRKAVERRLLTEPESVERLAAIQGTLKWEGFDHVDVVVEAALEDLDAKRTVFRELESRTRPGTVLATNTSSLPVESLQEGLTHPERVAGMHFFNPVHKMPLVEVARAPASNEMTLATLTQWAINLGKTPVLVRDSPGFVVNRILMPYLNEAVILVAEGLAIEQVDRVMKRFGMPMGPLELLDQIGLDIAAHVAESMQPVLTGRFEPNAAFEKMRAAGLLGQKSGRGFYLHAGKKPKINSQTQQLLRVEKSASIAQALPEAARVTEGRERMVLLMVNEAALALSEKLTTTAAALNLAMVLGTGWAPHRGGPLRYADDRGLGDIVQSLTTLAARHGKRFEPCAELKRRAEANEPFTQPLPALV